MNKGCAYYFKEGFKIAKDTFSKDKKNYLKYYLFLIASFIGRLSFVTMPIFNLANVRLIHNVKKNKNIELFNSFEGAENPKKWWRTLVTNSLWLTILLAGVVIIFFCAVQAIPFLVSIKDTPVAYTIFTILVFFVTAIVISIYSLIASLYFLPVNYILNQYPDLSASMVLKTSFTSMSKDGKGTYIGIAFLFYLLSFAFGIMMAILIFIAVLIGSITGPKGVIIFVSIMSGLIGLIYFLFLPFISLSQEVAVQLLFDDIVQKPETTEEKGNEPNPNPSNDKTEIEIKGDNSKDELKELSSEELLDSLFDDESKEDVQKASSENPTENESKELSSEELLDSLFADIN